MQNVRVSSAQEVSLFCSSKLSWLPLHLSRICVVVPSTRLLHRLRVVRFVRDYMNSIPMPMQQFLADPLHHLFE